MEIDMTSFILSTCGHMTELVSHAVRRDMAARDGDCSGRFSVRFMEVVDIQRLELFISLLSRFAPSCAHVHSWGLS